MESSSEFPFRLAFGIFWILNTIVRYYFQGKARGQEKSFSRHERREQVSFNLFLFSYLFSLVYVFSSMLDFAQLPVREWIRWMFGGGALIFYLLFFSWTHYELGRNWSGRLEIYKEHHLVTDGPYRHIRHPMYSAFFLSAIGVGFLSANWLVSALYLGTLTWMYVRRVASEEEMMIERFDDQYREYMISTGRLMPRWRRARGNR